MPSRLIAERTVDSLFAYEALTAVPAGILVSPTNTDGMWDHKLFERPGGRFMIFECKAVVAPAVDRPWRAPVDRRQLHRYLQSGGDDLIYLFLARPTVPEEPWLLRCSCARRANRWRRTAAVAGQIQSVSVDLRLQPWFSHWAWCMTAADLQWELKPARNGNTSTGTTRMPVDDADFQQRNATRLCHLLMALSRTTGVGQQTDADVDLLDRFRPMDELPVGGLPASRRAVALLF